MEKIGGVLVSLFINIFKEKKNPSIRFNQSSIALFSIKTTHDIYLINICRKKKTKKRKISQVELKLKWKSLLSSQEKKFKRHLKNIAYNYG